jgi:hypothetical protein
MLAFQTWRDYLWETTMLNQNLRKIACYIPYSRQVLPKCRKTVRMNFRLSIEEDSQWKMVINMDNTTGTEWKEHWDRMVSWKVTKIEQNKMVSHWRLLEQNGIIKEVTVRWRTSKDADWELKMKAGDLSAWSSDWPKKRPLRLVFWLTQKGETSAWSSDWPKKWLFSVQSSSTEPT